jgi:hypothetical protein
LFSRERVGPEDLTPKVKCFKFTTSSATFSLNLAQINWGKTFVGQQNKDPDRPYTVFHE